MLFSSSSIRKKHSSYSIRTFSRQTLESGTSSSPKRNDRVKPDKVLLATLHHSDSVPSRESSCPIWSIMLISMSFHPNLDDRTSPVKSNKQPQPSTTVNRFHSNRFPLFWGGSFGAKLFTAKPVVFGSEKNISTTWWIIFQKPHTALRRTINNLYAIETPFTQEL